MDKDYGRCPEVIFLSILINLASLQLKTKKKKKIASLSPMSHERREAPACEKLAEGAFSRVPCSDTAQGWLAGEAGRNLPELASAPQSVASDQQRQLLLGADYNYRITEFATHLGQKQHFPKMHGKRHVY